jgi:hypothetical protein
LCHICFGDIVAFRYLSLALRHGRSSLSGTSIGCSVCHAHLNLRLLYTASPSKLCFCHICQQCASLEVGELQGILEDQVAPNNLAESLEPLKDCHDFVSHRASNPSQRSYCKPHSFHSLTFPSEISSPYNISPPQYSPKYPPSPYASALSSERPL